MRADMVPKSLQGFNVESSVDFPRERCQVTWVETTLGSFPSLPPSLCFIHLFFSSFVHQGPHPSWNLSLQRQRRPRSLEHFITAPPEPTRRALWITSEARRELAREISGFDIDCLASAKSVMFVSTIVLFHRAFTLTIWFPIIRFPVRILYKEVALWLPLFHSSVFLL